MLLTARAASGTLHRMGRKTGTAERLADCLAVQPERARRSCDSGQAQRWEALLNVFSVDPRDISAA
jgi:hypothetical protein